MRTSCSSASPLTRRTTRPAPPASSRSARPSTCRSTSPTAPNFTSVSAGVAANHPPTVDDASGLIAKREEKRPWFTGSNADLDDPTSNLLPEAVEWLRDSPATIVLDAAQIGRRVNNPHDGQVRASRPDGCRLLPVRTAGRVSRLPPPPVRDGLQPGVGRGAGRDDLLPPEVHAREQAARLPRLQARTAVRRAARAVAVPAADADADDAPASGAAAAAAATDEGGGGDAAEPRVNPLVKLLLPLLRRGDGDGAGDAAADDADGAAAAPAAEGPPPSFPTSYGSSSSSICRRPPRDSPPTCPRPPRGSV